MNHLFILQVVNFFSASLFAFGILNFGASNSEHFHSRDSCYFIHLNHDPPGDFVPTAVESLARIVEDDFEGLHSLGHSNHVCVLMDIQVTITKRYFRFVLASNKAG